MARVILHVPEQEFVLDSDANYEDTLELVESGNLDFEYDMEISDFIGEIVTDFIIEEN